MEKRNKTTNHPGSGLRLCSAAVLITLLAALTLGCGAEEPPATPAPPAVSEPKADAPLVLPTEPPKIELNQGLTIERLDRYAGRYMEDGTNDIVQDVMMLIVHNTTQQDLQLAGIRIAYPDFTAEFEVTNLPAGERAVLLEKNRRGYVAEEYLEITTHNVVFFPEKMDLMPEVLELGGTAGVVEVTNLTDADLEGPVYIYYKNSAEDLLYGGITYRVLIAEGLAAGETARIPAGHYAPTDCRFLMVTTAG